MQIQKQKQGYKLVKSLFGKYEEIPKNWEIKNLKQILEIPITDGPHITPVFLKDGIPFISVEAIKDSRIDFNFSQFVSIEDHNEFCKKCKPQKNDILLVKAGSTTGKIAIVDVDFDFSVWSPLALIRISSENSSQFYYHLMQSQWFQKQIQSNLNLTTQPNIGMGQIKNLLVIVPPMNEQEKIATIFSNINLCIQQTQKEIGQIQKLKKGLMQKLLTKGIGHTKFKEAKLYPKYLSTEIPEDWEIISLYDVTMKIADRDHTTPTYVKEGIMIISPTNLDNEMNLDLKNIKYISIEDHEKNYKKTDIHPNDILFSRIGAGLGKSYLVKNNFYKFSILHSLCQIRANEKILPEFLLWFLRSNLIQKRIWVTVQSIGVPDLGLKEIGHLPIFLVPLEEQQKISLILSNVDSQIQKLQEYKSNLENLKKGLMQKLLTGQIRVQV